MKKILMAALILTAAAPAAFAQERGAPMSDSARTAMQARMTAENEALIKELGLTDAQKEQWKKNAEESRAKMAELRNNASGDAEERRNQMRTFREEQTAKLKTILTPEQFTKYEAIRQKQMDERRAAGGGGRGNN